MPKHQSLTDNKNQHADSLSIQAGCIDCLSQCLQVLDSIDQAMYERSQDGNASVGAHLRHIVDRFQCFLSGMASGLIDYDNRQRDARLQASREAGIHTLGVLGTRIRSLDPIALAGRPINVRESVTSELPATTVSSTLDRELLGLISHSIHHLALISMILQTMGINLAPDIGKAPSTIRHERKLRDTAGRNDGN